MEKVLNNYKSTRLFIILAGFFVTNALIAEFIGIKIFSLEKLLGFEPLNFSLLGQNNLSFSLSAGVLLWPVVFVMTDIINEYYGQKGVKMLSNFTVFLLIYSFFMLNLAIKMSPADFWITSNIQKGVPDMNAAFASVFGQGMWIIAGSLTAFITSQIIDVFIFHKIKQITGEKYIWLRATGSTLVSQFIDSFVVLFIAFYLGANWSFALILAVCTVNYFYKFFVAIAMTPILYFVHNIIESYLGKELADIMKKEALLNG
ncbi:MAG: membrane protein [Candidatus Sericytochromatia bacterium]|nr:MAG: membrane protein [Candidatus Sericytochromatia bacterium]